MNFWFENMPSGNPAAETFSIFAAEALLASQSWRLIKTLALFARALIGSSDRKKTFSFRSPSKKPFRDRFIDNKTKSK
jgi:hypothetical protein